MAKWLITVQNPNYCGVSEGVPFVSGAATVENEIVKNILVGNYGYQAELIVEQAAEPKKLAKK